VNFEAGNSLRRQHPADMVVEPWTAPDGWTLRRFRLAAETPARGEILFLGGRGDFFEKYLEAFVAWRRDGWNVSGFDWRGQGGSGRVVPGDACHVDDFAVFLDDLDAFCSEWSSEGPGPHVGIAHSMGAHILLRAILEQRVTLDGAVLLSPMLGIRAGPLGGSALHGLASVGRTSTFRHRPIWRGTRSPAPGRVTSCPERQADKLWWKSVQPELGRGGPTWGWLAAATASIAELNRVLEEHRPTLPGLLLGAADDVVVDPAAIERASLRLPSFDYGLIHDAGHELLRERDEPRTECMNRIRLFLNRLSAPR
jgi:lysophospholipase